MTAKYKELRSQRLDEQDRFDAALTNLSIDCFEFSAYQELLNELLQFPDDRIKAYHVFSRTLDRFIEDLYELRCSYAKIKLIDEALQNSQNLNTRE